MKKPKEPKDEMISLFVILGILTLAVAVIAKLVLFSPIGQLVETATK